MVGVYVSRRNYEERALGGCVAVPSRMKLSTSSFHYAHLEIVVPVTRKRALDSLPAKKLDSAACRCARYLQGLLLQVWRAHRKNILDARVSGR